MTTLTRNDDKYAQVLEIARRYLPPSVDVLRALGIDPATPPTNQPVPPRESGSDTTLPPDSRLPPELPGEAAAGDA